MGPWIYIRDCNHVYSSGQARQTSGVAAARKKPSNRETETSTQRRVRMALQVQVGARIAELRTHKTWTQAELAEPLRVNMRHVQLVEAGRANMTLGSLSKFAKALDVDVRTLFDDAKPRLPRPGRPRSTKS